MAHWGWYWHVKKRHKPKKTCFAQDSIDSFDLFKNKEGIAWVKNSQDRVLFQVFEYKLTARLLDNDNLAVSSCAGPYIISVEKMRCNFGGTYQFFHCPDCNRRMRKLYLNEGRYMCRTCASLGYYTQRLRSSERLLWMGMKVKESLENQAGSLKNKPPRMKRHTFQKLRKKYLDYDEKQFNAIKKEIIDWYGPGANLFNDRYSDLVPMAFLDLYDYKD